MTSLSEILKQLYKGGTETEVLESLRGKFRHYRYNLNQIVDDNGWSMLHWAIQNDYPTLAAYVLAMGIHKNIKDKHGCTPLMLAAFNNQINMIKLLIFGNSDDPAVRRYCAHLLDQNKDPLRGEADVESFIQLVPATKLGPSSTNDMLRSFMEGDDKMNDYSGEKAFLIARNSYGSTALHYASFRDQKEAINALLEVCPELVDMEDNHGDTALHHACQEGYTESIAALLEHGADCNKRNRIFLMPLEKGIKARALNAEALNMLHDCHASNLPPIMSAEEVRHRVAELQKDETERKFAKRKKQKQALQMQLEEQRQLEELEAEAHQGSFSHHFAGGGPVEFVNFETNSASAPSEE